MRLPVELERGGAGDDEEELVAALVAAGERAAGAVANDALLEVPGARVLAEDELLEGGVALAAGRLDVRLGDDEGLSPALI